MKLTITYDHSIPINAFQWTPSVSAKPLHMHTSLEIGLCTSGQGEFQIGDKRYAVSPGDLIVVNNQELHIARSDAHDPSCYIFVNFDPGLLLAEEEALLLPFAYRPECYVNRIPAASELAAPAAALVRTIHRELETREEGYRSMAKSALLELCVLLLRNYATGWSQREWQRLTASFRRIRPALALIDQRYREQLELADVAAALGMSSSQASRFFTREMGRSFKDYLLRLRLREAKRLLLSTRKSAAEVCFESGFQSVATFYRLFKSEAGMSPQDYRRENDWSAIIEKDAQPMSR
ncbi:helix-turn-helix transcriptional regulator [Paenibacillus sp. IB182496]|uniref:Helix-turn-helix transcriptional regulator n=1 Tax=Paenibacillus sabuli TaxID=2772509 RepID=A0A927BNZ4_9BACL|nr:AraC family transcriptional regulator [Paenibacillus sabuli]MBD2843592.1 helix-turn-helix transcriptional regulator [Paenibacillus sabuli]